jgi:hypothetical protein
MLARLALAVWPKPTECPCALAEIESTLLIELQPPLNLTGVATAWTERLKAARAVLAREAEEWSN